MNKNNACKTFEEDLEAENSHSIVNHKDIKALQYKSPFPHLLNISRLLSPTQIMSLLITVIDDNKAFFHLEYLNADQNAQISLKNTRMSKVLSALSPFFPCLVPPGF